MGRSHVCIFPRTEKWAISRPDRWRRRRTQGGRSRRWPWRRVRDWRHDGAEAGGGGGGRPALLPPAGGSAGRDPSPPRPPGRRAHLRALPRLAGPLEVALGALPLGTHPSVVDSVLLRYIGPRVSLFDIYVDDASAGRVHDWLLALSRFRVESIHMRGQLRSVYYFNLHSSVFSFADLVSLRRQRCNIPSLPIGFVGFPALLELDLKFVRFLAHGENQLEAIIRRSPLLHALDMSDVSIPPGCPDTVIEAANLRSLTIYSHDDDDWQIGELPCLEYANIQVTSYPQDGHNFGDFLARFAQVPNLTLLSPVDDVEMPYTLPFTFYYLKNLKLYPDFTQMHPILFMFTLLRSCHNLEKLEIEICDDDDQSIEANWEFLNALWTDGMCANLQVVQIIHINWLPNEISFMKLILSKARLLRTLYVGLVQQY